MIKKAFKIFQFKLFKFLFRNSPRKWADFLYWYKFNKKLDWDNPKDINEKINWLKFNHDTSLWTRLADKYRMREYVESLGYGEFLPKLYGKWDRAEDIEWDKLPMKFVMKVNNGSGDVLLCENKDELDKKQVMMKMNRLMKTKFGLRMAEPHYNSIKPCIIAEEYLDPQKQAVPSERLNDYKIWVMNGVPLYILVCSERTAHGMCRAVFDLNWTFYPQYTLNTSHSTTTDKPMQRPKCMDEMLKMAAALSHNEPQVRVDFYEVDGKPYIGELTFTSLGGFHDNYSQEFLDILGDKCKI